LSNAIKYSPADTRVTITSQKADGAVQVSFCDQGPGIPDSEKKLIFKRFHRIDSTSAVSGTGLGLPIARELIEMHRGSIRVESELKNGSTFILKLPLSGNAAIAIDNQFEKPADQSSGKPGRLTLLHKGLILVSIPLCFELITFGILLHL